MESPQQSKADRDLSKVYSFERRQDIYNILHSEKPDHYSRLWLVGFMKFCGYSINEICSIIRYEASWANYDDRKTWCQVNSVFRSGRSMNISTTPRDKRTTSGSIMTKCVSPNPCSDAIDGYCYLAPGEYHIPSVDERTRRALDCMMDSQIAKFQRQKKKIAALQDLLL